MHVREVLGASNRCQVENHPRKPVIYLENIGKHHFFKATVLLVLGGKLMEINVATAVFQVVFFFLGGGRGYGFWPNNSFSDAQKLEQKTNSFEFFEDLKMNDDGTRISNHQIVFLLRHKTAEQRPNERADAIQRPSF